MSTHEITGVVINSNCVTNDPSAIHAALLGDQKVEYVSRDQARLLALRTKRSEWGLLAEAPAIFIIIDGVRYRRSAIDAAASFSVSMPTLMPMPALAG